MNTIILITSLFIFDQNAQLQMQLAQQTAFQQRVSYILMQEAFTVLGEASNTPNHANRYAFAVRVRDNVNSLIANYTVALVGRPNLVAETTTCNENGCTTTATDAEIASQVASDWNLWSGQ